MGGVGYGQYTCCQNFGCLISLVTFSSFMFPEKALGIVSMVRSYNICAQFFPARTYNNDKSFDVNKCEKNEGPVRIVQLV